MIRTAIRFQNNMVVVFDREGEQVPEYQGRYKKVKESILKDAPPNSIFGHLPNCEAKFKIVPREEW